MIWWRGWRRPSRRLAVSCPRTGGERSERCRQRENIAGEAKVAIRRDQRRTTTAHQRPSLLSGDTARKFTGITDLRAPQCLERQGKYARFGAVEGRVYLTSPSIDAGGDKVRLGTTDGCQGIESSHPGDRQPERCGEAETGGDTDPDAGERSRSDRGRQAVEPIKAEVGFGEAPLDRRSEPRVGAAVIVVYQLAGCNVAVQHRDTGRNGGAINGEKARAEAHGTQILPC